MNSSAQAGTRVIRLILSDWLSASRTGSGASLSLFLSLFSCQMARARWSCTSSISPVLICHVEGSDRYETSIGLRTNRTCNRMVEDRGPTLCVTVAKVTKACEHNERYFGPASFFLFVGGGEGGRGKETKGRKKLVAVQMKRSRLVNEEPEEELSIRDSSGINLIEESLTIVFLVLVSNVH